MNSPVKEAEISRVFRNFDPNLRSQEKAVEYVRALNAAKLEKIFARPFVAAMDGHRDGISCMAKNQNHLKWVFSGAEDGDIRLWDLAARRTVCQFSGHQGKVSGLSTSTDGGILVSCGLDSTVRLWRVPGTTLLESNESYDGSANPLAVHVWNSAFSCVDHQWDGDIFATGGARVDIWNHDRSQPVNSFEWGTATVRSVRFNPGEPNILAASASDRSIIIYDLRTSSPARKLVMMFLGEFLSYRISFCPDKSLLEICFCITIRRMPYHGTLWSTAANEDCNCYSYDARKLDEPKYVHKDHVSLP